jgi:hypothetical protein
MPRPDRLARVVPHVRWYKAILTTLSEATAITERMPRVGCACSLNPCLSGCANPHHVSSVRSLSERRPETPLRPAHLCSIVVPRCAGGPSTIAPVHQRCRERASRGQPTAVDVQPGRSVGKHRPPRSSSATTQSPTPTTPLSWHREAPPPFSCRHRQSPMVSSPPSRASKQPPRIGGHLPDRLPPPHIATHWQWPSRHRLVRRQASSLAPLPCFTRWATSPWVAGPFGWARPRLAQRNGVPS